MTDEIWKKQCAQRRAWINEANMAWRAAIALQQRIKNEQDELVRLARIEFMRRKSYPAPPYPGKTTIVA